MADPLRRTLLAKLRGKKSKKGATVDSTAAYGGREGNHKVLVDCEQAFLSKLDCTTERMSTYENCSVGNCSALLQTGTGGVVFVATTQELSQAKPQTQEARSAAVRKDERTGVSLQKDGHFERHVRQELNKVTLAWGKQFVSRQCSGDSIGFGDSSSSAVCQTVHSNAGQEGISRIGHIDIVQNSLIFDSNTTLDTNSHVISPANPEEHILIHNIESYDPEFGPPTLQSPTFFPTELEICELNMASLCGTERLESEDDDYYDNEILPFYETVKSNSEKVKGEVSNSAMQETDRLRNQLQEAYYLLINAMNDINMDVQQVNNGVTEQQVTSSCSSHSRDSLCSRLSAKNMDSDSWSSGGEQSPQQVSDTDSLLQCVNENLQASKRKSKGDSKSMVNLNCTLKAVVLQRSASDGGIRYLERPLACRIQKEEGSEENTVSRDKVTAGVGEISEGQTSYDAASGDELPREANEDETVLCESSGSTNSLTGSSDSNTDAPSKSEIKQENVNSTQIQTCVTNKTNGVTVNKMQEWMHKGRLLSSEMKQRIEGSSPPLPRTKVLDKSAPNAGVKPATPSKKAKSSTIKSPRQPSSSYSSSASTQPAFIENIQPASCANGREGTTETSGWRPPLNTITVSKKRNWLQQSSLGKSHFNKDETQGILGAEEEGSHLQHPSPSPSPDHLKNTGSTPSRPARLLLPQVNIGQVRVSPHPRCVDPMEENDADDEGDIWYNPIPEDDEPDQSHGRPSIRLLHPPRERRGGVGETAEAPAESTNVGDAAQHSSESIHVHRQILACRNQEDCGPSFSKPTDGLEVPSISIGFSPPSSPNPTKKSSAINWSFPDKIKSPRTVRKISMKMKKLPELSRKLSVKGPSSSSSNNNSNGANQSEPRSSSPKNNGTEAVSQTSGPPRLSAPGGGQASRNVISRYHLDSSVSTQGSFSKKKSRGSSKSASKGGYLSDGDSPELVAKSGKHGSSENKPKSKEMDGRLNNMELDIDAFRHYSFTEQPKCSQYISGLMNLHFYGAEDLKPPRIDSRDVYCAIQVDSVNKARTALLTCRTTFLDMDHTFNIELENAQHLKLVVFSWEPMPKRNKVCCHGTVVLPTLFRVTRTHQLAVKLEPRGLIYVKLSLMEQWQNSLDGPDGDREPVVFGVEAWRVVERENMGLMVPLLISKCINEIEKRGCQVVGLYRLCGSAAVKKELREAFERDSPGVELCENTYPDINVITGVLKDYLRELPYPLINKPLYEAVLESMALRPLRMGTSGCENDPADSEHTVGLLDILPDIERMTLHKLLDHLKLVASYQEVNKMTCQNLAVCFGPVLLSQRQEATCHSNRVFIDSEELASALHFKKHIEVLHYLLQLWPAQPAQPPAETVSPASSDVLSAPPIRRRKERPQVLNFTDAEMAGVLRPKPGRLDSPSNRYAGDWSGCGENYFPVEMLPPVCREEADYDDVASEDNDGPTEEKSEDMNNTSGSDQSSECVEQEQPLSVETEAEEVKEKDQSQTEANAEQPPEEQSQTEADTEQRLPPEDRLCEHILPPLPKEPQGHTPLPKEPREHTYQAYMKIQDISPVLSNRVNLRDLQESIDTLIGNLERELNKNKLNVGY
ncbi:hypothetical protein NQD34_002697 [Periophthalmus magnuspinnatus]|nr:hypothetical protein NQD34_002697 [Periophthalmus magnuspinnatus]